MAITTVTATNPTAISVTYSTWWVQTMTVGGGSAPPGSAAGKVTLNATLVKVRDAGGYMEESPIESDRAHIVIPDLLAAGSGNAGIESAINAIIGLLVATAEAQGATI